MKKDASIITLETETLKTDLIELKKQLEIPTYTGKNNSERSS
jgi:hypothetical protein